MRGLTLALIVLVLAVPLLLLVLKNDTEPVGLNCAKYGDSRGLPVLLGKGDTPDARAGCVR